MSDDFRFSAAASKLMGISEEEVLQADNDLAERLMDLGAPANRANSICFAYGQRLAAMAQAGVPVDLSFVADSVVDAYRNGQWDEPGPELAARLCEEYPPRLDLLLQSMPGHVLDAIATVIRGRQTH